MCYVHTAKVAFSARYLLLSKLNQDLHSLHCSVDGEHPAAEPKYVGVHLKVEGFDLVERSTRRCSFSGQKPQVLQSLHGSVQRFDR